MTHLRLTSRALPLLLLLSAIAFVAMPAAAQTGFMQIDEIEGEATDSAHRGWIDILSVSYDWGQPSTEATGQGRRRSRVTYGDLVVVKDIDAATPLLISALSRGTVVKSAKIELVRRSSVALRYELENVIVTSHAMRDGKEYVSLAFESITVAHPASARETTIDMSQR